MGTEAEGTLTVGGQKVNVRADFASDHVTFSGGRRGEVAYSAIQVVGTAKGILRLRVDDAPMEFVLATRWNASRPRSASLPHSWTNWVSSPA